MSRLLLTVCAGLLMTVSPAYAYLGPGMGVGTVGVIVGILSSIFIALFAVLWYPFKRMIMRRKAQKEGGGATVAAGKTTADTVGRQSDD